MVLPAWPPLAAPASPALLLKPELLHAGPISAATKRAAATVDILNIWSSVCSPAEHQTQSTGLTIQLSSHKLRLGLVTLITRTKGYVACHARGITTSRAVRLRKLSMRCSAIRHEGKWTCFSYRPSEVFFTGTACEVTPVREIDKISIGTGEPGPITRKLQAAFTAVVKGATEAHSEWLAFL
jgi:hypothetical protein